MAYWEDTPSYLQLEKIIVSAMPALAKQQTQKLIEVGEQLRQKRQQQALSLTAIASKTLIREHLLEAIEQGKLAQLPEPIYIHALIKQYTNVLGLESEEVLNSFTPSALHTLADVQPARKIILATVHLRPIHLYLLHALVITCSVSLLSLDLNQKQLPKSNRDRNHSSLYIRTYAGVGENAKRNLLK